MFCNLIRSYCHKNNELVSHVCCLRTRPNFVCLDFPHNVAIVVSFFNCEIKNNSFNNITFYFLCFPVQAYCILLHTNYVLLLIQLCSHIIKHKSLYIQDHILYTI